MRPLRILFALVAIACAGCVHQVAERELPKPFNENADAKSEVADSILIAHEEGKHVLLVFGANWCSDSRATVDLFESDAAISKLIHDGYVAQLIETGERAAPHNRDLVEHYHAPIGKGIPALLVLDENGKLLNDPRKERLDEGDHNYPERIAAFLRKFAPETTSGSAR